MAIARSIAKKQDTNEQVGLQLLFESNRISAIIRIGSFRPKQNNSPPIFPPQILQKRGKQNSRYKTDGTEIWQCRGGITVTFASAFSGFLFTTAQHAYLLRIFTEVWQQILSNHKGRKGKSGQAGNFISPYSWSQNRGQVIHGEEIWQYCVSAIAPRFLINCHSIFPFVFLQDT